MILKRKGKEDFLKEQDNDYKRIKAQENKQAQHRQKEFNKILYALNDFLDTATKEDKTKVLNALIKYLEIERNKLK